MSGSLSAALDRIALGQCRPRTRLAAVPVPTQESERRFAGYLDTHGYDWDFEPDYQQVLGLGKPVSTHPDFLVARDDERAICEVQQFDLGEVDSKLADMKYGVMSEKDVYGRARLALVDKARQLEPFADLGVPLVVVLSNPLGAFVPLDEHHMISVIFGNPKWTVPIDTGTGGATGPGQFIVEDYGAFVSLAEEHGGARFIRRNTHVSAVVVLHQRTEEQDFIDEVMSRHPSADDSFEAAATAALAGIEEVEAARRSGVIPNGAYQWLDVYELADAGATPLPSGYFAGPRDKRHGFVTDGTYGELPES